MYSVKKVPTFYLCHLIFHLLKEVYVSRTSNNQTLSSKHDHLPKIFFDNLLHCKFVRSLRIYKEALALSVKRINFISSIRVKAGLWKVGFVAIYMNFSTFANHSSKSKVPNEMVMCKFIVIKDINEQMIIVDKAASDIRVWKAFVNHCVIVDSKYFINVDFIFFNLFFCSGHFFEVS